MTLATDLWHAVPNDGELLGLLIQAGCPAPCVGVRQPDGEDWHAECEARGREAFVALRGWVGQPEVPGA